jgi:DinB superfamily
MKYECIADIYSANQKIRENFKAVIYSVSPDEEKSLPLGEKWTVGQIAEHVALVGVGTSRICAKLLAAAKVDNLPSDGGFSLSPQFGERAAVIAITKVDAPDRVHPTGQVSIADAIQQLDASSDAFDSMRSDMERLDLSYHTFPHPFFGELTAGEWMVIAGLHEGRHLKQIETVLAKVRQ